jgi:hypothetical protein
MGAQSDALKSIHIYKYLFVFFGCLVHRSPAATAADRMNLTPETKINKTIYFYDNFIQFSGQLCWVPLTKFQLKFFDSKYKLI